MSALAAAVLSLAAFEPAAVVAILAPLVIVPMGVITFYLRAMRDQIASCRADLTRRIESAESARRGFDLRFAAIERDYAVKEDWVRESMLARRNIERLAESVAAMGARLDDSVRTNIHQSAVAKACDRRDAAFGGTD